VWCACRYPALAADGSPELKASRMHSMTWRQRAEHTLALWPFTVPLVVVYFAEYVMQVRHNASGTLRITCRDDAAHHSHSQQHQC
jgi:hypothetical protein